MAVVLTAGERHEQFALDALMDKGAYRERNKVERLINRLKQYRASLPATKSVLPTPSPWSRSAWPCSGSHEFAETP